MNAIRDPSQPAERQDDTPIQTLLPDAPQSAGVLPGRVDKGTFLLRAQIFQTRAELSLLPDG